MIKVLIFFALFSGAFGDMSMTEELLMAQNELNIAFEFTELYLINQMTHWIDNMTILTEEHILPGFFDAREEILSIIEETSAYINSFEVAFTPLSAY
jgi:hypothetical protein